MRMLNYNDYRAARRFPALDGLRAVAAVMVVFFHFGGPHWTRMSGWSGVQIFFVLSGFLITTLALREEERSGRISLRAFYLRRVFRILPVYAVVLAVLVGVYDARDQLRVSGTLAALPYYASTVLTDFAPPGGFIQSWTIGIEQKFYLLWPLLAFAAGAIPLARRAGLTVLLLALSLAVMAGFDQGAAVHYATILIGCLLALLMHDRRTFRWIRPLTHPIAGVLIAAGFVVAQLSIPAAIVRFGGEPVVIAGYSVAVALLLPSLLHVGPLNWVLSSRPFTIVGERSYALYLVQGLAGIVVVGTLNTHPGLAQVALTVLVSLLAADVLHRWVEQPMIGFGRRLATPSRRRAAVPATVAAGTAGAGTVAAGTVAAGTVGSGAPAQGSPVQAPPAPAMRHGGPTRVAARVAVPAGSKAHNGTGTVFDANPRSGRGDRNRRPVRAAERTSVRNEAGAATGAVRDHPPAPGQHRSKRSNTVTDPRTAPSTAPETAAGSTVAGSGVTGSA